MPDTPPTEMVNCHVHTFTTDHTPRFFPHPLAYLFRLMPDLVMLLRLLTEILGWERLADRLKRIENFHRTGSRSSQRAVFREVLFYYPRSTRFVVLPLDMGAIGHGSVRKPISSQHDELAELARDPDYGAQVIPFGTLDPDRADGFDEFRRVVEEHGFRGLKLYPRLGYAPDHPVLMDEVYPYCVEHGLPVMSHCSRGGVGRKGWLQYRLDEVTRPQAFEPVLRAFPELRVCLAHFGGDRDWGAQLEGFDPDDAEAREKNWASAIATRLGEGTFPGLYTDISYTIFRFDDYIPLLRMYLTDERLRSRVLFGSDFYMTRQEHLTEKAVSIRLRDALGEAWFHEIAHVNPRRWLGEAA